MWAKTTRPTAKRLRGFKHPLWNLENQRDKRPFIVNIQIFHSGVRRDERRSDTGTDAMTTCGYSWRQGGDPSQTVSVKKITSKVRAATCTACTLPCGGAAIAITRTGTKPLYRTPRLEGALRVWHGWPSQPPFTDRRRYEQLAATSWI